ncbi:MAG TPA: isochorismatase family protein [Terrimicrobiaceae bacterium]
MSGTERTAIELGEGDALVIVDVQNDFLPGGALAVPHSDEILPVVNGYIAAFELCGLPIYMTRDWHPPDHCSFREFGGPWPTHCVADSYGAAFSTELKFASSFTIVSKATTSDLEYYSDFGTTNFEANLRAAGASRLFIGGLATDYCVLSTVRDALALGFKTHLLLDAIRGVDVQPGDSQKAEQEMIRLGAVPTNLRDLAS